MTSFQTRTLELRAATIDAEGRTAHATISTEQPVEVLDLVRFEPIDEILLSKGADVPGHVPLLESHQRADLSTVLGHARDIKRNGDGELGATLHFDDDEPGERAFSKIRKGHVRQVSAGYTVQEYTDIPAGETAKVGGREYTAGRRRLRVSNRWKLREVSIVPVGADDAATIRARFGVMDGRTLENPTMPENQANEAGREPTPAPEVVDRTTADVQDAARQATNEPNQGERIRREERRRISELHALAGNDVPGELVERAVAEGWSVESAAPHFLEAVRRATPAPVPNQPTRAPAGIVRDDERDTTRDVLAAALFTRTNRDSMLARVPVPRHVEPDRRETVRARLIDQADRFQGMPLLEVLRQEIRLLGGEDPGFAPASIFDGHSRAMRAASFSSHGYSNVFSQLVGAMVLENYTAAPDSTAAWTRVTDLSDFKTNERILRSKGAALEKLGPGNTAVHDQRGDSKETYKAARYAKKFAIDEQEIIDDQLSALMDEPEEMGEAAAQLRPDLVYSLLLANGALNADSTALFHSDHSNTATAALAIAALTAGVAAMAKQTQGNRTLNLRAANLLVPQDLWGTAYQLLNSTEQRESGGAAVNGVANPIRSLNLVPIVDNRIGAAGVTDPATKTAYTGSATNWFLTVAGGRHTVEVGYVRGTGRSPVIRSYMLEQGQWGQGWDVKLDIGAAVLDYRGLYRSTGAG